MSNEKVSEEVQDQVLDPLLIGSEEWRLHRFLETHLSTRPFLCDSSLGSHGPRLLNDGSVSRSRNLPARYQQAAEKFVSKAYVAGTVDTATGKWHDLSMIPSKCNESQTSEHVITAGNVASKALNVAGKFALAAAVVIDSYRLGKAVYEDMKEQETLGKRTAKTSASVASGWAGGFAGAAAGNSAGAVIGGTIGAAFGGIGAIPGAAVGSLVGCLVGGVTAGVGASMAAENIVDMINKDDLKGHIFVIDGRHICIKPSFQPENNEQDEEWLEIVKLVVTVAVLRKQVGIVAKQSLTEVLSYEAINSLENYKEYTTAINACELREIYYISRITAKQDTVRELCDTPQFFCSFLLILVLNATCSNSSIEKDLKEFELCEQLTERKLLPSIKNEILCMTDAGFALVWFNPNLGIAGTLNSLKPHFPYLEIVETKKLI